MAWMIFGLLIYFIAEGVRLRRKFSIGKPRLNEFQTAVFWTVMIMIALCSLIYGCSKCFADPAPTPVLSQASDIETDTTHFNGNLSSSDDTVQKALETLDDMTGGGGGSAWGGITGTISDQSDLQTALNAKFTTINGAADGSTKGIVGFSSSDFDSSSGIISLDYTNGQAATDSLKGFLTAADHAAFSALVSSQWTTVGADINRGSGNVGIGSGTPGQKLDVAGTVRAVAFSGPLTGNVTGNVTGTSGSTTGNAATATALAANGTNCLAGNYPLGVDASGNSEGCTSVPSGGTAAAGNNAVQYNSGSSTFAGNEAVFSFNGSNVGIGTTNGVRILDVRGTATFTTNVGIGTTNPANLFQVGTGPLFAVNLGGSSVTVGNQNQGTGNGWTVNSTTTLFGGSATSSGSKTTFQGGGNANSFAIFNPSNKTILGGYLEFQSGNVGIGTVSAMRIVDGGRVGIGTIVPGQLLDVQGTTRSIGFSTFVCPGFSGSGTTCTCSQFSGGICCSGVCT